MENVAYNIFKEIVMKATMLKNRFNNEHFVCDDIRVTETIDGVEYIRSEEHTSELQSH